MGRRTANIPNIVFDDTSEMREYMDACISKNKPLPLFMYVTKDLEKVLENNNSSMLLLSTDIGNCVVGAIEYPVYMDSSLWQVVNNKEEG